MMKKGLIAAAMMCVLSVATVMCVHAAEPQAEAAATEAAATEGAFDTVTTLKELKWDDKMQQMFIADGFAGTVYDVDALGMQMLVPEGLEKRQPTEEELAKDTKLVFENAEKAQKIELVVSPVGDCKTLDDVKAFIEKQVPGVVVLPTKINEFDTLVYGTEETNSMCVLIGAGDAGFLRVICHPLNDPQMKKLYSYVAASIQTIKK